MRRCVVHNRFPIICCVKCLPFLVDFKSTIEAILDIFPFNFYKIVTIKAIELMVKSNGMDEFMNYNWGRKYLVFVFSCSVKMRGSSAFSVCIFLRKVCLFFNFWMHNYVKQIITVNFIIQKLKNKHIFLKKYTNWESWGTSGQENLTFSVCILFRKVCLFFNFWMIKCTIMSNKA